MPSKRTVIERLSRDELLAIVDRFELAVADRRAKDGLVDAVASSKKATLTEILPALSRDRLKEICRALDLDDSGREKSALVERLAGTKPAAEAAKPTNVHANGTARSALAPEPLEISSGDRLTIAQLERYLWSAADILRGSIDSSDYKNTSSACSS